MRIIKTPLTNQNEISQGELIQRSNKYQENIHKLNKKTGDILDINIIIQGIPLRISERQEFLADNHRPDIFRQDKYD